MGSCTEFSLALDRVSRNLMEDLFEVVAKLIIGRNAFLDTELWSRSTKEQRTVVEIGDIQTSSQSSAYRKDMCGQVIGHEPVVDLGWISTAKLPISDQASCFYSIEYGYRRGK